MRRIAIALILVAAVVGIHACAADAPTAPRPPSGGGTSSAITVQLFATDANPKAGTCALIEALVSYNGAPAPDGTSVNFSTDFGTFGQNGLPLVSDVTTGGHASTAICGPSAGTAKVKATATVAGKTNSGYVTIIFQPDAGSGPHVSYCSPSFGPKEGGTTLTLNGGGFTGAPNTTRAQFTVNGVSKDGLVTAVTSTAVTVTTPGFPEIASPSALAAITLTFNASVPPIVVSLPNCFAYGTADAGTPTITAVLPSSGTNEGNTRVSIVGSGFSSAGVQVFFGGVEATVVSASYNQVVALSPPAFGAGDPNRNQTVPVTVKNIASGLVSNASVTFSYTPAVKVTSISNNTQSIDHLSPVTIFGQGFQAPVAVGLAGVAAVVQSVSATEIVALPTRPLAADCNNITGPVTVTNIDSGDTGSGAVFTYLMPQLVITGITPGTSCPAGSPCDPNGGTGGLSVVISGANFPTSIADADVKFGNQTAFVTGVDSVNGTITVTAPITTTTATACANGNPQGTPQTTATVDVIVRNRVTGCSATAVQSFQYQQPCTVPPTPTP